MKRKKQAQYITIPYQGIKPEWVGGVSTEELLAAQGIKSAALGTASVSYTLKKIAEEFPDTTALLVDSGDSAVRHIYACRDAGITVDVLYTDDVSTQPYIKLAHQGIRVGESFSPHYFTNGYLILKAVEECGARVLLLTDPLLAENENFLGMAAARSLRVFVALDAKIPQLGWVIHQAQTPLREEEAWRKCPHCELLFDERGLTHNHFVCPACKHYFRMNSRERIQDLLDADSFIESSQGLEPRDPLAFPGYRDKLASLGETTGLDEAVCCGTGRIAGIRVALCVMDSSFLMGSMGSIVGEKITRTVEQATQEGLPLFICTASGGARMQEGLFSLMQMAKVSAAVARHAQAGLLYVSALTDPTTGGVTASFALQGDIILAEPRALIGFAGQRVIRDTIKRELPEGFQTAEFALEHGLIDMIVERKDMRETLAHVLALHEAGSPQKRLEDGSPVSYAAIEENLLRGQEAHQVGTDVGLPQIKQVFLSASQKIKPSFSQSLKPFKRPSRKSKKKADSKQRLKVLLYGGYDAEEGASLEASANETLLTSENEANRAWESVKLARNTQRPTACYYLDAFVEGFIEFHGDRAFGDDGAIVGGIGWIGTTPVTVIAQEKGANLKERIARNFGCPQPEGYRKSLRLMKQAEKFGRPVVCLVDTQGAYCGVEAEERGQGNALADNLFALATLQVPVISVLIGEGGSGGALALALADRVAMQCNAVYSILSPEGFASILWKDSSRAPEAAAVMKMSAQEAYEMGIIDAVLPEGEGAAHENPDVAAACVRGYLVKTLDELSQCSVSRLLDARYDRFRKF